MDYKGLNKKEIGDQGENLAIDYLKKAGLQIIQQKYRCPKGEIDIVAKDGGWLVIVEVRTRTSSRRGYAEESITYKKLQRLRALGSYYLLENGYREWPLMRFDIVAINYDGGEPVINWIKGIQ